MTRFLQQTFSSNNEAQTIGIAKITVKEAFFRIIIASGTVGTLSCSPVQPIMAINTESKKPDTGSLRKDSIHESQITTRVQRRVPLEVTRDGSAPGSGQRSCARKGSEASITPYE